MCACVYRVMLHTDFFVVVSTVCFNMLQCSLIFVFAFYGSYMQNFAFTLIFMVASTQFFCL